MKKLMMLGIAALGSVAVSASTEQGAVLKSESKYDFEDRWSCKWYFKVYEQNILGGYTVIHTESVRISGTEQEMLNQAGMHKNMMHEMWVITNPGGKNRYIDYGKDTSLPCLNVSW